MWKRSNFSRTCVNTSLIQHKLVHKDRDVECFGCDRMFKTDSGMMIHLESGTCESQRDVDDVDYWALTQCRQRSQYSLALLSDDGSSLSSCTEYQYHCPACSTRFKRLSGLLQHSESLCCSLDRSWTGPLEILLRFMRARF